jgi:hypothetical protein
MPFYVQPDELAAYRRIGDNKDDQELESAIDTAEADVDEYCGWGPGMFVGDTSASALTFSRRQVIRYDRESGTWIVQLPRGFHTTTGLVVETDDTDDGSFGTTWTIDTDFEVAPVGGIFGSVEGFPYFQLRPVGSKRFPTGTTRMGVVRVTAQWGWAAVPVAVLSAVHQRASALHARRSKSLDGTNPLTGFRAGGHDRDWDLELSRLRHPRKLASFA